MDLRSALLTPELLVAVLLIAVGLLLRLTARLARRVGDTPHCDGCDYVLTGIDSDRCPECGRPIAGSKTVRGERPQRRQVRIMGAILTIVGLLILAPVAYFHGQQVHWYRYRPSAWVVDDAASADKAIADKAWSELDRRRTEGSLAADVEQKLIAVALDEQMKPEGATRGPNWQRMVDDLYNRYEHNGLTAAQADRFLAQVFDLSLSVRKLVAVGDRVPYRVDRIPRRPSQFDGWFLGIEARGASLDGVPLRDSSGASSEGEVSGGSMAASVAQATVGMHELTIKHRVELRRGRTDLTKSHYGNAQTRMSREIVLRQRFEVVNRPSNEMITVLERPELEPAVRGAIELTEFDEHQATILFTSPPENIAFKAFIVTKGLERSAGTVSMLKSATSCYYRLDFDALTGLKVDHVDLVLRSSAAVARTTVDLTSIWGGDIIFKDVKVQSREDRLANKYLSFKPTAPSTTRATTRK